MGYPALKINLYAQAVSVALHVAVIVGGGLWFMQPARFGVATGRGGAQGAAARQVLQAEVRLQAAAVQASPPVAAVDWERELSPVPEPEADADAPPVAAAPAAARAGMVDAQLPVSAVARRNPPAPPAVGAAGAMAGKLFTAGDGGARMATAPGYLSNPPPPYPLAARQQGRAGRVLLRVTVSASGAVSDVRVKNSSGHAVLDAAAVAAVRRWRFAPATVGGVAVGETIDLPVVFSLRR
jgi:protein TonB